MKVDCQEHRKTMELLSLRKRQKEGITDPKELKEVKERIRTLERELRLD
jgi:ribosomal protein L30/L7E